MLSGSVMRYGMCKSAKAVVSDGHVHCKQVSGSVDGIFQMGSEGQHRSRHISEATAAAHEKAAKAGADPKSCKVVAMLL